jgi:hypothetical protein
MKVKGLQQKKINLCKTAEILKYIVILKKSVPVIQDLISNSDSLGGFKMAMQLIFNAAKMVD